MMEVSESTDQMDAADIALRHAKPTALYYFAYGANMNKEQLRLRGVRPIKVATAKLPQHEIGFYGHSRTWDGGMETVVRSPDRELWGVIYKLSFSDGDSLDGWQDVRLDGTGGYFDYPTTVIDTEGKTHPILLYKKDVLGPPQKPSQDYLDFIVKGALEQGLPLAYIESLRRIESKKAGYAVPVPSKFNRGIIAPADCSQCEGS